MQKCGAFVLCFYALGVAARVVEVNYFVDAPLPFPPCHAYDIDCQRRGIRTFFFLMDNEYFGMEKVDPACLSSVTISFPDQQMDLKLRNVNVTGARWTKLVDRKFNLADGKSSVIFASDLHVTGDILMNVADTYEPYWARITMDIQNVESNITYSWYGQRAIDKEDYILVGPERIAVRNSRTPTYFLQPVSKEARIIDELLQRKPTILDHLSNEITASLMHTVIANFRSFGEKVPVKYYYKYIQYLTCLIFITYLILLKELHYDWLVNSYAAQW